MSAIATPSVVPMWIGPGNQPLPFAQARAAPIDFWDVVIAGVGVFFILATFCALDVDIVHWFLFPVFLSGLLVGVDAVRWLRAKMDTFDPKGVIGVLGVHFFVVAPLLVVYYDFPSVEGIYIDDWRPWLGSVAALNCVGLVLYQVIETSAYRQPAKSSPRYRVLNVGAASLLVPMMLVFAILAHVGYLLRIGGIGTLVDIRTYGVGAVRVEAGGFGPLMVIGRSIPIFTLLLLTLWRFRRTRKAQSLFLPNALLVVVLALQVVVSGAAGSRSDTAYQLLWALGVVHFVWRRISVKWILLGLIPFICFMYLYSFYKNIGSHAFGVLTGKVSLEAAEYESKRTFVGMLVGDLSRADVQAAQFSALVDRPWYYRYRWGGTYLASVIPIIPRTIWPDKPTDVGKVAAGTELLWGPGTYASAGAILMFGTGKRSTRVYGLAGEAMLNFGPWSVPLAFGVFGYIVARIRRRMQSYRVGDARLFLAPFFIVVSLLLLTHDTDNLVMQTVFNWLLPAITIYIVSYWARREPAPLSVPAVAG